ncbi:MAG: hypothetical protein ABIO36_08975 [Pyrinomonadaceae bacterium]
MGVLLMLMTIGGVLTALILLTVAVFTKRSWLTRFTLGGVAVWFVFYAVMLLGFSLSSSEEILAFNEAKEYCGFYLDCHMHTVVAGVRTAKQIGDKTAAGEFYIVKVKVFSDAKNPNIPFRLLEPKAEVTDGSGRLFTRDHSAEDHLPTSQIQLGQDIKGRQAIEKEIVFDITGNTQDLKLLITEGYGIDKYIEAVLIGDDDSLGHKHTYFKIAEKADTASR